MKWDQDFFERYLDELQAHLFQDMSVLEIIELAKRDHHQARRQMNLHILRSKEVFRNFYERKEELGIQFVFDQTISGLFHETEKKTIKLEIIELFGIEQGMIENNVEGYGIKEFDKDLLSFIMYWRKRRGDLAEELPQVKEKVKRYLREMKDAKPN